MPIMNQTYNQTWNNLTIDSFTEDNNGNYTCVASTNDWVIRSNTALVQLVYLTSSFDGGSESMTVQQYSAFVVYCMPGYDAYPADQLEFEWFFLVNGEPKSISNDNSNVKSVSRQLYIRKFNMARKFECRITSLLDNSLTLSYQTSVAFDGVINNIAEIYVKPQDVVANVGDTAVFYCISSAGNDNM